MSSQDSNPDPSLVPQIYMLGSSTEECNCHTKGTGIRVAAQINAEMAVPVMQLYRQQFRPQNITTDRNFPSISVFTVETEEEAYYQAAPTL